MGLLLEMGGCEFVINENSDVISVVLMWNHWRHILNFLKANRNITRTKW